MPGRPPYVPRLIARLHAATGQLETALELWEALRESATSDWAREIADREIAKLKRQPARSRTHEAAGAPGSDVRTQPGSPSRALPRQKSGNG